MELSSVLFKESAQVFLPGRCMWKTSEISQPQTCFSLQNCPKPQGWNLKQGFLETTLYINYFIDPGGGLWLRVLQL